MYLKKLEWLSVKDRIRYKIIVMVKKCIIGKQPKYLYNILPIHQSDKNTRSQVDINLRRIRSNSRLEDRLFPVYASQLHNQLPPQIRKINNISIFKKVVKKYLLNG